MIVTRAVCLFPSCFATLDFPFLPDPHFCSCSCFLSDWASNLFGETHSVTSEIEQHVARSAQRDCHITCATPQGLWFPVFPFQNFESIKSLHLSRDYNIGWSNLVDLYVFQAILQRRMENELFYSNQSYGMELIDNTFTHSKVFQDSCPIQIWVANTALLGQSHIFSCLLLFTLHLSPSSSITRISSARDAGKFFALKCSRPLTRVPISGPETEQRGPNADYPNKSLRSPIFG